MSEHEWETAISDALTETESISGNIDPMTRVLACAIEIAHNAAAKQGKYSGEAKIYWPLIHKLRDALDDLGAEWRRF